MDLKGSGFLKNAGYPPEVYETEPGKHKTPTVRRHGRWNVS